MGLEGSERGEGSVVRELGVQSTGEGRRGGHSARG